MMFSITLIAVTMVLGISGLLTTPPRPAFFALCGATYAAFGIFFLDMLFSGAGWLP